MRYYCLLDEVFEIPPVPRITPAVLMEEIPGMFLLLSEPLRLIAEDETAADALVELCTLAISQGFETLAIADRTHHSGKVSQESGLCHRR